MLCNKCRYLFIETACFTMFTLRHVFTWIGSLYYLMRNVNELYVVVNG